ncbi:MAG: hypothetical protein AAF449_00325 [Myxococcota bacterium]
MIRWAAPAAATAAVMVVFAVAGPARTTAPNLHAAVEQAQSALTNPQQTSPWVAYNEIYWAFARRPPEVEQAAGVAVAVRLGSVLLRAEPRASGLLAMQASLVLRKAAVGSAGKDDLRAGHELITRLSAAAPGHPAIPPLRSMAGQLQARFQIRSPKAD